LKGHIKYEPSIQDEKSNQIKKFNQIIEIKSKLPENEN
jgi:hypothetical protein